MAYIKDTAFEVKVSNHEFDSIANVTGVFYNASSSVETCAAGFLCNRGNRLLNEGYGSSVYNTNSWEMTAAADGTGVLYACNPFDVNMIEDPVTGAQYKVGSNTLGIPEPAGYPCTFTEIKFNGVNVYRFGVGNVSGTIGSNTYFSVSDGLLVPGSSAASTPYFELRGTGNFTQGAYNGFGYIDVVAAKM